ncbi:hypothetical protein CIPAW_04G037800 [Carya illinoinensis]|uniref:Uncharacterized protein n=1 Tax=Carya illinoinensis TaxID=32201 RepID=A0A8T1QQZ3_CARIL|nr:hypothetical protein CIPAW_04G037800 [Carya illinoinensis]
MFVDDFCADEMAREAISELNLWSELTKVSVCPPTPHYLGARNSRGLASLESGHGLKARGREIAKGLLLGLMGWARSSSKLPLIFACERVFRGLEVGHETWVLGLVGCGLEARERIKGGWDCGPKPAPSFDPTSHGPVSSQFRNGVFRNPQS